MTEGTSEGQVASADPDGVDTIKTDPSPGTGSHGNEAHDSLNAAIAATAGEVSPEPSTAATEEASRIAAQDAYIKAGTAKVMAELGDDEIVSRRTLPGVLEALLRHLHQDHPDNYRS